jgi:hydroxyacylglutathione hydrolase
MKTKKLLEIKKAPMGELQTNCYILDFGEFQFIIDSGIGAFNFIEKEAKNPVAILLTHGHFDHIFDAEKIANKYEIPIYINKGDEILLGADPFGRFKGFSSKEQIHFAEGEIEISGIKTFFHKFSGHSKGSCVIEIENSLFVGDLIFRNSIGRFDFPYSDKDEMMDSLRRFLDMFSDNTPIYTGHGENTFLENERKNIQRWIQNSK